MRMRFRRMLITLACLLGGIALTAGTAWGCLLWSPGRPATTELLAPDDPRIETLPPMPVRLTRFILHRMEVTGWEVATVYGTRGGPNRASRTVVRAGWPCYVLQGEEVMARDEVTRSFLVNDRVLTAFGVKAGRRIPWGPIWLPFLTMSLATGGAMWLIVAPPVWIRWLHRRRTGRCLACGYDIRSAGLTRCPECGKADEETTRLEKSSDSAVPQ